MNSFNVTTQAKPDEVIQYSPVIDNEKFSQMSLVEPTQQVVDNSQLVAVKNEENIHSVPTSDDQKEHGSTSLVSKTTYTCHVCSKKYKHRNCLVKHLWEHHESWELCLKFNLTKHQQVQMMEAAQILVDLACIKQH
ncbi:hypothetical protein Glove_112g35 [Diversispora epigaea]|uniref:C2H2-type domain-containing protein n=1 Tax=Diversispora epigaea TaxID=1348612 RepID=A0A397J1N5_9GLOM|nr:hypothetical protein Glove_112g35 [Diversispora epigaea]